jgi:nucleotide-binding universal stress UspA family protein
MSSTASGGRPRVVVGLDGSSSSLAAVRWAADYAALVGARLELVVVWDWPTSYGWPVPIPSDYNPEKDASELLAGCEEQARRDHAALEISSTAVQGHPAPALVEASNGAALLVVGSRGHGQFAGMLLGSVSEHCVSNAHCPVLVMRGEGDGS